MWFDRLSFLEVDLGAIGQNYKTVKKIAGERVKVCAAVKANAYGHGLSIVSKHLEKIGVDFFAVASLSEALFLRNEGITSRILLLGYSDPRVAQEIVDYDLTPTVYSIESVEGLVDVATKRKKVIPVHVKVDTGMGRLGLSLKETASFVNWVKQLPNIELEGIFTHFACSEEKDNKQNKVQIERFNKVLSELKKNGIDFKIVHAANSGAILNFPQTHFNMVRPGMILYGYLPGEEMKCSYKFKSVLTWKTKVTRVVELPAGECISYGCDFRTKKDTRVATLAAGYADGVRRGPKSWREVLVKGKRAKVIGRVCMDQMMVDVSGVRDVAVDDEVVLIGRQGKDEITVFDVARWLGTSHYEVLSQISDRVVRIAI